MKTVPTITKILITGGSGMVGQNLQNHPAAKNFEIFAPSSRMVNLLDFNETLKYVQKIKPDLVVHAAGKVGGIQANLSNPVQFLEQNVSIGRNIIMSSYLSDVPRFLNLASTCIYPKNAVNPLCEDAILTGQLEPTNEGYAIAKIMALRLCQYINIETNKNNYKTIIPCNLYGAHDEFDPQSSHLIPAIINKIHNAKVNESDSVEIWGDGNARREFMHVSDLADAVFRAIGDFGVVPELFNCGVGIDHTINDYYNEVADVIGWNGKFIHDLSKPAGMQQKLSEISRQTEWGWMPKITLKQGIKLTYDFYLKEFVK